MSKLVIYTTASCNNYKGPNNEPGRTINALLSFTGTVASYVASANQGTI